MLSSPSEKGGKKMPKKYSKVVLKADLHSDCYLLKEISYERSVKSPNTQCGGVIIFQAANDSVFV